VRQQPIGPYIADFACREHKIVVEIDGGTHSEEREIQGDQSRTRYLEAKGYRVFRAQNVDVYESLDAVIESLLAFVRGEDVR
jgi:very-short-patch-repair endonuclease